MEELGLKGFPDGIAYDAGRPGYPAEAVDCLLSGLGLHAGSDVLDLGAGTGKLTIELVERGMRVIAVEPSEGMRTQLAHNMPTLQVLAGTAENIPLDDKSLDAVIVAQAFHWFDAPSALAEITRVLRDDGGLGLIWNERDESVEWVAELSRVMGWHEHQPYRVGMDFTPVVTDAGLFTEVRRRQFQFAQRMTKQTLEMRVLSTSYIAALTPSERAKVMEPVSQFIDRLHEPIDLPYVTDVYTCSRATS